MINDNYMRTLDTLDSIDVVTESIFGEFSFVEPLCSRSPLSMSSVTLSVR